MARYTASVDTPKKPAEAFEYLSDLSNAREWDPGVVEAERLAEGPVAQGSQCRLVAVFLSRRNTLTYRVVEYDPPAAVTFRGENASVLSLDLITLKATAAATRVSYDADLTPKGALRIADLRLGLAFRRVGYQALAGLRAKLAG
jgi:hypothetical protein